MYTTLAHRLFWFAPPSRGDDAAGRSQKHRRPKGKQDADAVAASTSTDDLTLKARGDAGVLVGDQSQAELISRLQSADLVVAEGALEVVHAALYAPLWRTAYRILQSHDLADELVQDVFIHVWEHRQSLIVRGSLSVYLHVAIRNRAYKHLRHDKVVERHAETSANDPTSAGTSALWPSPVNDPMAALAATEADRALLQALQGLSERDREILVLRWRDGWGFDDIAQLIGITSVAARTVVLRQQRRLTAFLERLREELRER
jgi:RNA polymerase sigma-70 factor (ECF subfamily)